MTTAADIISSFTFSVANNVTTGTGSQITLTQNLAEHQERSLKLICTHTVSHTGLFLLEAWYLGTKEAVGPDFYAKDI